MKKSWFTFALLIVSSAGPAYAQSQSKTDNAADKANRDIVGDKTQNQNEKTARDPRNEKKPTPEERKKEKEGAKRTGEAVGSATTTAAEGVADVTRDVTRATDQPAKYNPFAISLNPLGLFVGGRVSVNLEYAPVTHHVVILSPHFVHTSGVVDQSANATASETFSGLGGELGYRYYTGHRGMNGVFIGPSLIVGAFNASLPGGDQSFTNVGLAADVGVQQVIIDHLVLGAGVGIEYLKVSHDFHDLPSGPSTIASTGLKPRLLAQAGYAF